MKTKNGFSIVQYYGVDFVVGYRIFRSVPMNGYRYTVGAYNRPGSRLRMEGNGVMVQTDCLKLSRKNYDCASGLHFWRNKRIAKEHYRSNRFYPPFLISLVIARLDESYIPATKYYYIYSDKARAQRLLYAPDLQTAKLMIDKKGLLLGKARNGTR